MFATALKFDLNLIFMQGTMPGTGKGDIDLITLAVSINKLLKIDFISNTEHIVAIANNGHALFILQEQICMMQITNHVHDALLSSGYC